MGERRCFTEGIWQGTGEEEVGKAKEHQKKKGKQCLGRKELHD